MSTISVPSIPTTVGQRVRATGYGGKVRQFMVGYEGVVVRFTPSGNPVVKLDKARPVDAGAYFEGYLLKSAEVSDRFGCFKVINEEGKYVYEEVEVK